MTSVTEVYEPYKGSRRTGDFRKFIWTLNNKASTDEIDLARIPLEGTRTGWRIADMTVMNDSLGSAPSMCLLVQIPGKRASGELEFYKPTTVFEWNISGVSGAQTWILGWCITNESGAHQEAPTKIMDNVVIYDQDMFVYFNSSQPLDTGICCVTLERVEMTSTAKIISLFEQARRTRVIEL